MTEKTYLSETRFAEMALAPALMQGIAEAGFVYCTLIQAQTLPLALAGQDVAGQAQTGTGKTAAFLLALLHHLLQTPPLTTETVKQPSGFILAPTRELAIQIYQDALVLGRYSGLSIEVIYGGMGYKQQRAALTAGVDVIIGTPGRLIDYFKQGVFSLKYVQCVVIDEADRMFDLGFIKDLRFLLKQMPPPETRLNLLFSATFSLRVHELAYEHLNAPQLVQVDSKTVVADKITETLYHVATEEKLALLLGLLQQIQAEAALDHTVATVAPVLEEAAMPYKALIFVNTKRTAETVWRMLQANGYRAALLSGDVPQKKRMHLLQQFQTGQTPILVATDVAARGLHIPTVSDVINFDFPQDPEDYVHRIGRTARAGASGHAISLICEEYVYSLDAVQAYIGHKIAVAPTTEGLLISPNLPERRPKKKRSNESPQPGKQTRIQIEVEPATATNPMKKKRRRRSAHKTKNMLTQENE